MKNKNSVKNHPANNKTTSNVVTFQSSDPVKTLNFLLCLVDPFGRVSLRCFESQVYGMTSFHQPPHSDRFVLAGKIVINKRATVSGCWFLSLQQDDPLSPLVSGGCRHLWSWKEPLESLRLLFLSVRKQGAPKWCLSTRHIVCLCESVASSLRLHPAEGLFYRVALRVFRRPSIGFVMVRQLRLGGFILHRHRSTRMGLGANCLGIW